MAAAIPCRSPGQPIRSWACHDERVTTPRGLVDAADPGARAPDCFGVCPPLRLKLGLGSEQWLEQAAGTFSSHESQVQFDQRVGTLVMTPGSATRRCACRRLPAGGNDPALGHDLGATVRGCACARSLLGSALPHEQRAGRAGQRQPDRLRAHDARHDARAGRSLAIADDGTFELAIESRARATSRPTCLLRSRPDWSSTGFRKGARGVVLRLRLALGAPGRGRTVTATAREVTIHWAVREPGDFSAAVERRAAQGAWTFIEQRSPGATGYCAS